MKLWNSKLNQVANNNLLNKFNNSFVFDYQLWPYDIQGSIAHAQMLGQQNIITNEESQQIIQALREIHNEITKDISVWQQANQEMEDIHTAIEMQLISKIGDLGKKLHTGRSRNDQVATDIRLYLKDQYTILNQYMEDLRQAYIDLAHRDIEILIPGYTHLQQAQIISLGHWWLAHHDRLSRDIERLQDSYRRLDICPLGSGALAGNTYDIDRDYTASLLGFAKVSTNSLDAVSDRDFIVEFQFIMSLSMIHLSQLAEELIIYTSTEFGFFSMDSAYATGSSMMPQKKNPDIPELIRGKAGRIIGHLQAILIMLKGLPLAYNKDLQEDKENLFDTVEQMKLIFSILKEFILTLSVNKEHITAKLQNSYMPATDLADYLVYQNIPFRQAYQIVGDIIQYSLKHNKPLSKMSLEEYRSFHQAFEEDLYISLDPLTTVNKRNIYGATAINQIKARLKEMLNK